MSFGKRRLEPVKTQNTEGKPGWFRRLREKLFGGGRKGDGGYETGTSLLGTHGFGTEGWDSIGTECGDSGWGCGDGGGDCDGGGGGGDGGGE